MDFAKLNQMMEQAKSMQESMLQELSKRTATGQAGGGMVSITMNGNHQVVELKIDPIVVDKEDVSMLEDLVRAAINDATTRVEEMRMEHAREMAGQFGMPPGVL